MGHIPLGVSDKFRGKSDQGLYGDVMMEIDWSVGEISKALEKNNLVENTILIFTTDNGPWLNFGNHAGSAGGLREGKMTNWEGGQRVPFIIRWPGITPEGTVCNQLASAIDLLPTFASITNGRLSDNKIDGVDISSLLKGDFNSSPRETMLYYKSDGLNAVRKGNWKLVLPHTWRSYDTEPGNDGNRGKRVTMTIDRSELFDMMRDPSERYNVIDAYPEKVEEIMVDVEKARLELGDLNVGIKAGSGTRKMGQLK
jgi:arylsulfatase A-like enzyme